MPNCSYHFAIGVCQKTVCIPNSIYNGEDSVSTVQQDMNEEVNDSENGQSPIRVNQEMPAHMERLFAQS